MVFSRQAGKDNLSLFSVKTYSSLTLLSAVPDVGFPTSQETRASANPAGECMNSAGLSGVVLGSNAPTQWGRPVKTRKGIRVGKIE